jgi:diketogulonate reductase-like aldo/keto reductase
MHRGSGCVECARYCKKHGIILQAYASLGGQDAGKTKLAPLGGPLLEHPAVLSAAAIHGVSAAQVLLRWALQKVRCISHRGG